eukprot:3703126-Pleurochrysis_carterae.AAC.2
MQNGRPAAAPTTPAAAPQRLTVAHVRAFQSKSAFVDAWRAAKPPSQYAGRLCTGELVSLGILAPISAFITNRLFAPGRRWLGKSFAQDGTHGFNRFEDAAIAAGVEKRGFACSISSSSLDGKDCLVLDYADAENGDLVWGKLIGMRDEIREVAPGLYLGLGSLRLSGGMPNCQPFVLIAVGGDAAKSNV